MPLKRGCAGGCCIKAIGVGGHCMCSCFDRSNAAKEGVAPAAAPRPRREGLVLRVIVAEERLQKHVVEGSTTCAEEFWPL